MIDDPYIEFNRDDMILRDWLALDRTVLANKRTFLAFGRTSIALFALGLAFVKLIKHPFFELTGGALIAAGIVIFFVGLREFLANQRRFKKLMEKERAWEKAHRKHDHSELELSREVAGIR